MCIRDRRKVIKFGQSVNLGQFRIEFIKTNHSIVDAAALAIHSPAGTVVHTGDFKVDYTPVFGEAIDLQRFAELGKKGVLALMCDSTNAERQGFTPVSYTHLDVYKRQLLQGSPPGFCFLSFLLHTGLCSMSRTDCSRPGS